MRALRTEFVLVLAFVFCAVGWWFYQTTNKDLKEAKQSARVYNAQAIKYQNLGKVFMKKEDFYTYLDNFVQNDPLLTQGSLSKINKTSLIEIVYEHNDMRILNIFANKILNQSLQIISLEIGKNQVIVDVKL